MIYNFWETKTRQSGKQIVLTSDKAPRELNNIEARLKSRF